MSKRGASTMAAAHADAADSAGGGGDGERASKRQCGAGSDVSVVAALEAELKGTPAPSHERMVEILNVEMARVKMTHELLSKTGIGKVVGKLRKSPNKEVSSKALALVAVWKTLTPATTTSAGSSTPSSGGPNGAAKAPRPPKSVSEFRERLVANQAELYKDPPVLPPGSQNITKPVGTMEPPVFNDKTGCYHFSEKQFKDFTPNLSPEQVLRMGSFGGTYFRSINSAVTGTRISAAQVVKETLPAEWIKGMNVSRQLTSASYSTHVNKFKVKCGGSLGMWESSGWISETDPYGWFQWYCYFWRGRRTTDDARQIARAKSVMGPTGRFRVQLFNKIIKANTTYDDPSISPVIRQSLQHWGYQVTEADLDAYKKKKGFK